MNSNQFINCLYYSGEGFLNYILNSDIRVGVSFENQGFSESQKDVLDDFYKRIQEIRTNSIKGDLYGDVVVQYLPTINKNDLFNQYRLTSGGSIPQISSEDNLHNFLSEICISQYPILLLKKYSESTHNSFSLTDSSVSQLITLIKNDDIFKLVNIQESKLLFTTKNGIGINSGIRSFAEQIITRSFQNCCNKMCSDLNSLLNEIKINLTQLRALANDEKCIFSSFIGFTGILLPENTIDLGKIKIRQLNARPNPSTHSNKLSIKHQTENGTALSGAILEIINETQLESSQTTNTVINYTPNEIRFVQSKVIECLKFALAFSLHKADGVNFTFEECAFSMVPVDNYTPLNDHKYVKLVELPKEKLAEFSEWFELLWEKDYNEVRIALDRLNLAIYERKKPKDAIIDGVIAWEALFSEAFETTLKVTGSISKLLYNIEERPDKYKRLKDLYDLRSEIVHGKQVKKSLLKKEDVNALKDEIIEIGLSTLKLILKNDNLLKLTTSERIKKVLIMS